MVDVLEYVRVPDDDAAEFHFDALAADNEVDVDDDEESRVFSNRSLPAAEHPKLLSLTPCWSWADFGRNVPCLALAGYQIIVKGHYRSNITVASSANAPPHPEYVLIFLVVFRLREKGTDIVVSINYPVRTQEEIEAVRNPDTAAVLRWIDSAPGVSDAENTLKEIILNFEIVKWDLFEDDSMDEE